VAAARSLLFGPVPGPTCDRPEDDVLALTPSPLETAGERAFFAELTRWDTGGAVRAAVVASLPRFDDGPLRRRLADAVLFVPEGLAVVRVVEVERQTGTVTASPEGAWTIGAEGQPGDVLQMGGGGSSPLDGLMRAAMDTAVRLRQAGLEPGRIARLTVLVGGVTGLVPQDGDLGEGDQVASLETRSLLLGIARASRHSGIDNPRLWTTADVRAALEALELPGRGPTVEELNGEAFPYSPYVLRRRDLMAPAGLTAASDAPAPPPPAPAPSPVAAVPVAAGAAPAVGKRAMPPVPPPVGSAAAPSAVPVQHTIAIDAPPARDTVAVDVEIPPAAQADDTGGIGGLFANAEVDTAAPAASVAPPPVAAPPPPVPPVPPPVAPLVRPPVAPAPASQVAAPMPPLALPRTGVLPVVSQEPAAPPAHTGWSAPVEPSTEGGEERSWTARRSLLVALGALALVVLVVVVGLSVFGGDGDDDATDPSTAGAASSAAEVPAGPQPGDTADLDGRTFSAQVVDRVDSCRDHAYGRVAEFLAATDCTGLSRALWATQVDGQGVVVAVSRVQMPDTAAARQLQALADTTGTGNVNDLLREGKGYSGGPSELSGTEYASAVSGPVVTIVESSWVQAGAGDAATVDAIAGSALVLETPPFPAG
jgi:hypothetical protein